jgi:5'-nucleotidase
MEESLSTNRRSFIKNISMAGFALPFAPLLPVQKNKIQKLVILHTNDMHSHIDAFPNNHKKYGGKGGFRKIATLVKRIKSEEKNVLLLDAGDIFQGTSYFNRFKGVLELKLMSEMGYAASTMGNHDFDNGLKGFNDVVEYANFPFICSNYDFKDNILENKTQKYKIINFDNLKIGIVGVGIELRGLVAEKKFENTKYLDPIEVSNYWAKYLKKEKKCHLVICISHLGYNYRSNKISDLILARNSKNIDIIIGGHTHTFLNKATTLLNMEKNKVIVNQAGWGGLSLGRIDLIYGNKSYSENNLTFNNLTKKNYAKI